MEFTITQSDRAVTLAVSGRLDTNTAPLLEKQINELPPETETLVLDLMALTYTSSAGLRVLLIAQKKMMRQGQLILRHVSPQVREVLDITGFSDILTIEE